MQSASDTDASPLRHLLGHANENPSVTSRPGRMYSISGYDAAAFAATRDDSDDALTWQQLTALIGTGILIGSYAIEAQRRKRALMALDLDFER